VTKAAPSHAVGGERACAKHFKRIAHASATLTGPVRPQNRA
jgi:hypothetical protein